MYRVLVFGMTENLGGVESFLLNYYRNLDREKIQFDFLCNSYEKVAYEDELLSLGGRTFHIMARSKNRLLYKKELTNLFKEHAKEFDAIWINVCSLANIDYLKMAKKFGINKRIIHSHNSQNMDGVLRGILHRINKGNIDKVATDFWACSEEASKWFYKDDLQSKVVMIHNAIDVNRFAFSEDDRSIIRKQIGCENEFVIGNIGRLHFQKNQLFILDVFKKIVLKIPECKLILIGQGEDEEMLRSKAEELKISDKVIFAGMQKNVAAWLSAFDLFLFPSKFEGLSVVAMEAQANGVPVLASSGVIPTDVKLNDNFVFYSLNKSPEEWAIKLLKMKNTVVRKSSDAVKKSFVENGFEISSEVIKLEKLLFNSEE